MPLPSSAALSLANICSFLPIKREIMSSEMVACLSRVAQITCNLFSVHCCSSSSASRYQPIPHEVSWFSFGVIAGPVAQIQQQPY